MINVILVVCVNYLVAPTVANHWPVTDLQLLLYNTNNNH